MRIIEPADEQFSWCRNEPQIDREECVEANLLLLLHQFKFSFNTASNTIWQSLLRRSRF